MKKIYKILMSLVFVGILSSCNKQLPDGIIRRVEPSCTRDGYVKYRENGEVKEEILEHLGHDFQHTSYSGTDCTALVEVLTCTRCGLKDKVDASKPHVLEDDGNYITLHLCSECGCYGPLVTQSDFRDNFRFTIDSNALIEQATTLQTQALEIIANAKETSSTSKELADQVDAITTQIEEILNDVVKAYKYAETEYYVNGTDEAYDLFNDVDVCYTTIDDIYGKIAYEGYYSPLKDHLFEGWSDEKALSYIAPYGDSQASELSIRIDEICHTAYAEHSTKAQFISDLTEVMPLRQQLAELNNYQTYYEYQSVATYGRHYDHQQIVNFDNYAIQYCSEILDTIYSSISSALRNQKAINAINEILYDPIFKNEKSMKLLSDYLKTMKSETYGVDMFTDINNAFKEQRIFIGDKSTSLEGAFTDSAGSSTDDGRLMYFQNTEYYAAIKTAVHEMGHYSFKELGGDWSDFDFFETHSQSNEYFLLKYLKDINYFSSNIFSAVESYTIYDALNTILTCAAVDEYEYCISHNYSDLATKYQNGISGNEIYDLQSDIARKYGVEIGMDYYSYYVFNSPIYCVSYAISLVPCVALYCDMNNDLEAAKTSYYKLLSLDTDTNYDKANHDYLTALSYCGYHSPFEESTYQLLKTSFH